MSPAAPRLSVCMIVRDEAADLPRCLASLGGVADELVVVDTGSRDATPAIAAAAGARVLHATWQQDFAAARNASLAAATGAWCLVLDADEELPPETRAALPAELARAEAAGLAGLSILQRNLSAPGQLTAWEDLPIVRLFRRAPAHRYAGRIHEQISPAIIAAGGRIGASALWLVHHGYARATAQGGARAERNLALLAAALQDSPDDAYLHYQLGATRKAAGDAAGAEASLTRALALDRGALSVDAAAAAHMKLAQLATARHADAEALAHARCCTALQPTNVTALQIAVVSCVTLGALPEAADLCRALLGCANLAPASRAELTLLLRELAAALAPTGA